MDDKKYKVSTALIIAAGFTVSYHNTVLSHKDITELLRMADDNDVDGLHELAEALEMGLSEDDNAS